MSLRFRLCIAAAAGLLAAAAAITPAAADDWDPSGGNGNGNSSGRHDPSDGNGNNDPNGWSGNGNNNSNDGSGNGRHDPSGGNGNHQGHHDQRLYEGVVTANRLALRSAPNRGSQIIRFARRGDVVKIFCKTGGEKVQGNPLWYLLTDGTWAWGAARYIDNIGPAPRWC
ncbi:SH3 domain-containing protein [Streptomyces sp. NPDC002130]|uniref:SH3 domain-containing protein n=1 Tax=Streptomyces sp. NPDC002130 TaxID=3155568 RepID=UPI00331F45EE